MTLLAKSCVPCMGGIAPLTREEAERYLLQVPGWALSCDGRDIRKRFDFKNFADAMDFVKKLGELAEREGHHPDISFGWGYAEVLLYSHKIKGLHENDFIMAAKTEQLAICR